MAEQYFNKDYGGKPPLNYERFFVPMIGTPLAADLINIAELRSGEHVLDVACGTGIVARLASQQLGNKGIVVGLDVNAGMLEVASSISLPERSIEWYEAKAEAMPFTDESFDVVLSQMGLQFMPDKSAALKEMWRVLNKDGRLILNMPGPIPNIFTVLEEALAHYIGINEKEFVSQVFSLHDKAEINELISSAGFKNVSVRSDFKVLRLSTPEKFLWQYISSTPLINAFYQVNEESFTSFKDEVLNKWQAFVEDDELILKVQVKTVAAFK